ncbi:MAG: hypothetical protein ACHBN1_19375 [Heteroscytonema crispum UTEX LB 1556]
MKKRKKIFPDTGSARKKLFLIESPKIYLWAFPSALCLLPSAFLSISSRNCRNHTVTISTTQI